MQCVHKIRLTDKKMLSAWITAMNKSSVKDERKLGNQQQSLIT